MNPILISRNVCVISKKSFRAFAVFACATSIVLAAMTTTSCSTTQGFGRDVKKVGNEIEDAAR